MMDFSVNFCGVKFKNPLVLASGILGVTAASWRNVVKNGAGGITTKSIWHSEHKGHKNPVIIANPHYMMNAVGLPDAGIEKAREEISKYLKWKTGAPLIANIVAMKTEEFGLLTKEIVKLKPHIIEVNISCPNVEDEFGKPFACSRKQTFEVVKIVKRNSKKIPISIKLSPNVENILDIAAACIDAGADALTIANTLGPGMAIDINTRLPVLANKIGGISGPCLKPLIVKYIYDIYKKFKVPIIGTGGILTGEDAIEVMMAGAGLVSIGTGVYYRGADIFKKVSDEMKIWCRKNSIKRISRIIGTVNSPTIHSS